MTSESDQWEHVTHGGPVSASGFTSAAMNERSPGSNSNKSLVSLAKESSMLKELDLSLKSDRQHGCCLSFVELLVNIGTLKIVKKTADTEVM